MQSFINNFITIPDVCYERMKRFYDISIYMFDFVNVFDAIHEGCNSYLFINSDEILLKVFVETIEDHDDATLTYILTISSIKTISEKSRDIIVGSFNHFINTKNSNGAIFDEIVSDEEFNKYNNKHQSYYRNHFSKNVMVILNKSKYHKLKAQREKAERMEELRRQLLEEELYESDDECDEECEVY